MQGELLPAERALLHETVLNNAPKLVLEIGTWKGGGSTHQIATALSKNQSGVLHTCETNSDFYHEAIQIYNTDEWKDTVFCHHQPSTQLIQQLIDANQIPDFVFEDGPEDPELNMADFALLEPHLSKGAIFCAHDWDLDKRVDGGVSIKSRLVRPYIENSSSWHVLKYITKPVSVGMVVARRI